MAGAIINQSIRWNSVRYQYSPILKPRCHEKATLRGLIWILSRWVSETRPILQREGEWGVRDIRVGDVIGVHSTQYSTDEYQVEK